MCSPSPPPPADYAGAATAQGAANKETAIASSHLNNPNVVGPYGTQTFTEGSNPTDRPTVTQTLNPQQQALLNQQNQIKGLLGGLGVQGANSLKGIVGKNLDLSGAPTVGGYDATRQKVIDAMNSRSDEDYAKTTDQANSDLIAAGIQPGTKAYADKQQMIERSHNDARQQAEIAGGNAAAQAFNTDSQRRKEAISEMLAQRQTPLNEISALMSGSQVSNPFATPGVSQNTNMAPPPIFGAAQAQDQSNAGIYNAQQASAQSTQNGYMALAGTAAMMMF